MPRAPTQKKKSEPAPAPVPAESVSMGSLATEIIVPTVTEEAVTKAAAGGEKRTKRNHPGTTARRNIRFYMKGQGRLLPYAPCKRHSANLLSDTTKSFGMRSGAERMLFETLQHLSIVRLQLANRLAWFEGKSTVESKHVNEADYLIRLIRSN